MKTALSLLFLLSPALAADRAEDVLRDREVRRQAELAQGLHLLNEGKALSLQGRLEEAEASLRQAVARMPSSREAREELEGVRSALGSLPDRRSEILHELARARAAREDQQRAEVDGALREARRRMAEGRSAEALRLLREAQERLRWMGESDRVAPLLEEARQGALAEQARRRREQVEQAALQARLEVQAQREQEERRLDFLRQAGAEALRAGRFDEAERLASDARDPRLGLLAREGRHLAVREDLSRSAAEEWRNLSEFAREQQVPYSREVLRHPAAWSREGAHGPLEAEVEDLPWRRQLRERLRQAVHYKFDGVPFKDAKEYLEAQGKVVINIDRSAQDASPSLDEMPVHLTSPEEGMSLESALNFLTRQVNLKWTLRDESIAITTEEGAREPDALVQYDIRDLVYRLKDYPGPQVKIGQGGGGVEIDKEEEREDGDMSRDDLLEMIRKLVESSGGGPSR